jgi:hypothetical protein
MLIPHAASGGKTWQTARQSVETGYPVFTFDDEANTSLKDMGAKAYTINIACSLIFSVFRPDQNTT